MLCYIFCTRNCSRFGYWALSWLLCPAGHSCSCVWPFGLFCLPCFQFFLTFWHYNMFCFYLIYICPSPKNQTFLQRSLTLFTWRAVLDTKSFHKADPFWCTEWNILTLMKSNLPCFSLSWIMLSVLYLKGHHQTKVTWIFSYVFF